MDYKIIIAGTRTFNDYELLIKVCDICLFLRHPNIEVVSGGSVGADYLGEQYAKAKGYKISHFYADWNIYGRSAGPIRNKQMAEYADGCIVFWDGKSLGAKDMIKQAKAYNLKLVI